jgi:hypothetical protein
LTFMERRVGQIERSGGQPSCRQSAGRQSVHKTAWRACRPHPPCILDLTLAVNSHHRRPGGAAMAGDRSGPQGRSDRHCAVQHQSYERIHRGRVCRLADPQGGGAGKSSVLQPGKDLRAWHAAIYLILGTYDGAWLAAAADTGRPRRCVRVSRRTALASRRQDARGEATGQLARVCVNNDVDGKGRDGEFGRSLRDATS